MATAPASRARPIQGRGSTKEKTTTGTLSSKAISKFSGLPSISWVMKPTPKGRSVRGADERNLLPEPGGTLDVAAAESA